MCLHNPFTLAVLSKQVAISVFFIPPVDYIWFLYA